jgi:hypothetical protein
VNKIPCRQQSASWALGTLGTCSPWAGSQNSSRCTAVAARLPFNMLCVQSLTHHHGEQKAPSSRQPFTVALRTSCWVSGRRACQNLPRNPCRCKLDRQSSCHRRTCSVSASACVTAVPAWVVDPAVERPHSTTSSACEIKLDLSLQHVSSRYSMGRQPRRHM